MAKPTTLRVENEGADILDYDAAREIVAEAADLHAAYDLCLRAFPGLFIYRGGHHVAIHEDSRSERMLLIAEREPGRGALRGPRSKKRARN